MAIDDYLIEIFQPPFFHRHMLDIQQLSDTFGKNLRYASMGRYALYHVLKACHIQGKMLVPAYICESVLLPLRLLNIEPVFYDVDLQDLNADIRSIDHLSEKHKVSAVLVASMYGNPANLSELEKICLSKGILLIDDAAQSLGAKVDGRFVGTYGNAGFFSLSPGKPASGHMGAFFWAKDELYQFDTTKHDWVHCLNYWDFYFNRMYIYNTKKYYFFKILSVFKRLANHLFDVRNDAIAFFEKDILGGILQECLSGGFSFRQTYMQQFIEEFKDHPCFRVVIAVRGEPNNHKFVIIVNTKQLAQQMRNTLTEKRIFSLNGYSLLTMQLDDLPNCRKLNGRVIELPIENNEQKMKYLFEVLRNFRE